jgi:hypothetical protein
MLRCQKNKFWIENITNLFCTFSLIPLDDMNLAEQMNALTRLVIVIYVILLLFGFRFSMLFLLLSLLFITILYYIQKKNMETFRAEYYTPRQLKRYTNTTSSKSEIQNMNWNDLSNSSRFCNDEKSLDANFNNPEWVSQNQKLAGPQNPKTKIKPVVVTPSHDLSYWKANNLVTHTAINEETQNDVYQSGYQVSTCQNPNYNLSVPITESYCESIRNQNVSYPHNKKEMTTENFEIPYNNTVLENNIGQVNTSCGYNPDQFSNAGLPTNYPAGNCLQNSNMKQYNDNLYTQTIQPGVYTRNQINEPINSNIGISFTQQFPPTTCNSNNTGEIEYIEHDPFIIEPVITKPRPECMTVATEANIYDPRFSGYGTSYRSYTDDNLGQTRFYYDDIDAIRMPNYITRNNIDIHPFADHYGPIPEGNAFGNKNNADIRSLANDTFLYESINQRTNLQQSLMRKRNNEMSQLRKAPIRTSGMRMLGGMGSCNM